MAEHHPLRAAELRLFRLRAGFLLVRELAALAAAAL
jgi:hypothetical protein